MDAPMPPSKIKIIFNLHIAKKYIQRGNIRITDEKPFFCDQKKVQMQSGHRRNMESVY